MRFREVKNLLASLFGFLFFLIVGSVYVYVSATTIYQTIRLHIEGIEATAYVTGMQAQTSANLFSGHRTFYYGIEYDGNESTYSTMRLLDNGTSFSILYLADDPAIYTLGSKDDCVITNIVKKESIGGLISPLVGILGLLACGILVNDMKSNFKSLWRRDGF